YGFLVPIATLIILSQPPLFGGEIVASLCGVAWGAGYGFLVAIIGRFFGELLTFLSFRYLCKARTDKMRKSSFKYDSLGRVVEDSGCLTAIVIQYNIIPAHFMTAAFTTCSMKFWVFCVSAILSLPLSFGNVYFGAYLAEEEKGTNSTAGQVIKYATVAVTVVVSLAAMRYTDAQVNKAKPAIIRARQKAR
ncbi:hypothetical protein FIBSPDRAFT_759505, partial [Athelia psychrophila]